MSEPVFFTLQGDFRGWTPDVASDGNFSPENSAISATVTITPLLDGIVRATTASPRPIAHLMAPTVGIIDPADGRLKLRTQGEAGNPDGYTFTPIRLLANSDYLELDPSTPLFYRLTFTSVSYGGVRGSIPSWDFEAPSTDVTLNIVETAPQTGTIAHGLTKIAPGGVRLDGNNLVFTFAGADIPDPIPTSIFKGDQGIKGDKGDKGDAATIAVGTTSTLDPGSTATVSNTGTTGDAVLEFGIPRGDVGPQGIQGDAATIDVGTVTTVAPTDPATVTNSGTTGDAVFDFEIPQGVKGDKGDAATVTVGTVDTVLPTDPATVTNSGTAGDAVLDFEIPQGITGDKGDKGDRGDAATITIGSVVTGSAGTSASVANVGTATDAVFDIQIPRGDKGETGDQGVIGLTGSKGDKGDKGDAATVTVGTVSTGSPGSSVLFTNVGDSHDAVFDVTIPRGDKGETGNTGSKGDKGDAATIAVGTVSTLPPGSSASITNVGTSSAAVFDIAIPKGDTGSADATEWGSIPNKPAVVAAGANKADARSSIDAEYTGNKGQPNGYAGLDSAGKVPVAQLPNSVMTFEGLVDIPANDPALSDATGNAGQVYRVSVAGTRDYGSGNVTANVGDYLIHSGSVWQVADGTDAIASVNGYTGTVTLAKADLGLSAVDNTADLDKPISTATQTALDGKEPTINAGIAGQYWTGTKTWATLNKSAVGLGSADNTADLDKPISNATQTALNGKEPTIIGGTSAQYWNGLKSWATLDKAAVGLGNVDNTSDSNKPISTATQAALNGKEPTITSGTTGQYLKGDKTWATLNAAAVSGAEETAKKNAANGYAGLDGSSKVAIANLPTGTTSSTVAIGDDSRITGAEQTANKGAANGYAGLDSGSKVAIGNLPTGTTSSTVCIGNDSRLSDARTPTAHTHAVADINASTTTALGVGSIELGHASDTTLSRSAAGVLAVEGVDLVKTTDSRLTNSRTPTAAGQVADLSIVAFGANTTRATGTGDFPFGVKLQRAVTLTSVTYRAATADASGNLVVELRKNGVAVSGSSATIAAASQVAGGTATGTWSFAAGDIVTVYITAIGTTPGKGCIADITGVTA